MDPKQQKDLEISIVKAWDRRHEEGVYRSQIECIEHAIGLTQRVREEIRQGILGRRHGQDCNCPPCAEWQEAVARIYTVERWTDERDPSESV